MPDLRRIGIDDPSSPTECSTPHDTKKTTVVGYNGFMVVKSGEYLDPRVRRTRHLLQRALDNLLKKKDFNDISIQDIAGEATVNRATFYDHYADKFALLTCMIGCKFHELVAERQIHFDGNCAGELRAIVQAVCDYLVRMQGMDCKRQLEPHMESAIITAVREILLSGIRQHLPDNAIAPEIVAASMSWAIYGAAKEWAQTPDRCAPEKIVEAVTMLIAPILRIPSK
jgi:AcrR family transcriptional regulator